MSNNPPDVVLNLTFKQADFIVRNCDSNIKVALNIAMDPDTSEETQVRAASLGRDFQELKDLVKKATVHGD